MSDEEEEGCDCPAGLPAWMGTFADLMSLLMCFFVLLLSFSEMDAMKFKRLAGSMAQAFGVQNRLNVTDVPKGTSIIAQEFSPGKPEPTPINEIWQKTQDITEMSLDVDCSKEHDIEAGEESYEAGVRSRLKEKLEELVEETQADAYELASELHEQITAGEVEVETVGRKIIVRIREKGAFTSGSARLAAEYREVMWEIAQVLAVKPGKIVIQGHTDSQAINTRRFRSNWDLSSARALAVAHELMKSKQLKQNRFEVSGLADTKPLADNKTRENRARNRRVEILVMQGLSETLSEEDLQLLQDTEGEDILRELDISPDYLFELNNDEIF